MQALKCSQPASKSLSLILGHLAPIETEEEVGPRLSPWWGWEDIIWSRLKEGVRKGSWVTQQQASDANSLERPRDTKRDSEMHRGVQVFECSQWLSVG